MTHKTHTPKTIRRALEDGQTAFALSGKDVGDVLVGDKEEVRAQILGEAGLKEWPKEWKLKKVELKDYAAIDAEADKVAAEVAKRYQG